MRSDTFAVSPSALGGNTATVTARPAGPGTTVEPTAPTGPVMRVSVVDVDMPFMSMVNFMVKWALAAIPAFIILGFVGGVILFTLAALGMMANLASRTPSGISRSTSDDGPPLVLDIRGRNLQRSSYAQVVDRLGLPASQSAGVLMYRTKSGGTFTVRIENDHVISVDPVDQKLSEIERR